jgi:hypothetical protein
MLVQLLIDFFVFIVESSLLFVLAVSVGSGVPFFCWWLLLLSVDVVWPCLTLQFTDLLAAVKEKSSRRPRNCIRKITSSWRLGTRYSRGIAGSISRHCTGEAPAGQQALQGRERAGNLG